MLLGRPVPGEFGFSLNPFHYVKKAASGFVRVDKAILKNKLVQKGITTAANAYAPGSGSFVQAGLTTVTASGGGGGTVATPAGQSAAALPAQQQAPTASDGSDTSAAPSGKGGGGQLFGLPKKYVMIGGAVLGGVLLLSLLSPRKG